MERSWIVIALLAGCVDRVDVSPGTCGNWVLEPGEDCDRPDGTCTADCRVRCAPQVQTRCTAGFDGACCPDGFACGVDQACHAPGGGFAASEVSVPADLTAFRVGDLDGDGIADVLGYGPDAVRAFYGASRTPFATSLARAAPPSTGAPAIGDYDGDGRPDVVWPISDGLLAFSTGTGRVEPVVFPVSITPGVEYLRLASVISDRIRLDYDPATGKTQLFDDAGHLPHALCGYNLDPATLRGRASHPFDDGGDGHHIVIPYPYAAQSPGGPPLVCPDGPSTPNAQAITAPIGMTTAPIGEAFFAALDATACPALVTPAANTTGALGLIVIPGIGTPGACAVDASKQKFEQVGAPLAELVLATGDHAVITSAGVFGSLPECGGFLCEVLQATREWRYAVAADFDGDGTQDFAVASAQDDVEVFFQTADGWDARQVAIGGAATELAVGDYDGDGHIDLAMVVPDPLEPATASLRFAFSDGRTFAVSGEAIRIAAFADVATEQLADPGRPAGLDRADDLLVAANAADGGRLIDVYGAADRVPRAPWLYLDENGVGTAVVAQVGPYAPGGGPGVFGIFAPVIAPDAGFSAARIAGVDGGLFAESHHAVEPCSNGNFCPTTATYITVAEQTGALALGFAADGDSADCGVFYGPTSEPLGVLGCADTTGQIALRGIQYARALGIGAVDAPEIALATSSELSLWTVGFKAGAPAFTQLADLEAEIGGFTGGATHCVDAVAIELGARTVDDVPYGAGPDLAVACQIGERTSVFGVFASPTPMVGNRVEELFSIPGAPALSLAAGDIDGDGVEDLVYTTRAGGTATLHGRMQCDSRAACGAP